MLKESEGKNCQEIAKEGSSLESEQSPIICHLGSETKKLSCWGHADYNMPFWEAHFLCIIFLLIFLIIYYSMENTIQII